MLIEAGKYYQTRVGGKAGPAQFTGGCYKSQEWVVPLPSGHPATYAANGRRIADSHDDDEDLIAEWPLPDHSDVILPTVEDQITAETIAAMQAVEDRKIDALVAEAEARKPLRVQILHAGATLTHGDRDVEYGPPGVNMAAAGALKAAFRQHLRRDIDPAELEALDMVMTKLGRIATGAPKRDTYIDAATYFAIAGEIALTPTITEELI